jgi:hypothetical protein
LRQYITDSELKKIKYENTLIFANSSIIGNTVPVPLLADNFKLKKEINAMLESAHEKTKIKIAEMRKDGTINKNSTPVEKKVEKEPVAYEPLDKRLLQEPDGMSLIEKHYFYEEQIHAFYKRKDEDPKYLNMTIVACGKQIAIAKEVAKEMTAGKKRYILKSDAEIMAALKDETKDDLAIIAGTDEQKALLEQLNKAGR